MKSKFLLSGAAFTALGVAMSGAAWAQSTASQIAEDEIVVLGARRDIDGALRAEQAPKARQTVTQDFIDQQVPGQSILQSLNLVPGVTFANNDAYGAAGGDVNIRGFDSRRVSLTFDGAPTNDTGNYEVYASQQLDPELIERANVNLGTTDVDSPTASATGGTINYVSRTPSEDAGVRVDAASGSWQMGRVFGMIETGEVGPLGTRLLGAASYQEYEHFVGPGEIRREQYNAKLYQPIGENGDFVSIAYHYNEARNDFYRRVSLANFNSAVTPVYDASCQLVQGGPGAQDSFNDTCGNFQGFNINPSNTGNVRIQSRFGLTDSLTFTFDPSFQYVRANGGGTETISETDLRLIGQSGAAGVDLNGDGDTVDIDGNLADSQFRGVRLYAPSNTNTFRYGATSSLLWDISEDHSLRVGFTWDRGRHRQTGEYSRLNADAEPGDVFGGDFDDPILNAEGNIFQKRDRLSIASLSQWSAEYRGDFMEDALTLVLGVRVPEFERELDQRCYAVKSSTSSSQYCTTETPLVSPTPGFVRFAGRGTTDYAPPFKATVNYDDVLPNVGITYRPAEGHQVYFSYAEGLSAPQTEDLYGGVLVSQLDNVQPETSKSYDLGYRYSDGRLLASAGLWYSQSQNRIVRSLDPIENVTLARNIGDADLWGADLALGFQVSEALSLYGSIAYANSELQQNLPGQTVGRGLQIVEQPDLSYSMRAEYESGAVTFGLQARHVGDRYANDFNTEVAPDYTVFDADFRYDFGDSLRNKRTYLQLNIMNVFDEDYLGNISSAQNNSAASYQLGVPQTVVLSLRAEF